MVFKSFSKILIGLTAGHLFLFFLALPVFAAPELAVMGKPVADIFNDLISWLITVVAILAIMMMVIGGIAYISSEGGSQGTGFAKKIISCALLGLIIAGISYAIIALIEEIAAE